MDKPELLKANCRSFRDLPTEKVQALLLADSLLCQLDHVIENKRHIPRREYVLYKNSIIRTPCTSSSGRFQCFMNGWG